MSAWIEIGTVSSVCVTPDPVALYMSAWIEIYQSVEVKPNELSRTLHECVD